jgi:hypothetical protein
LTLCYAGLELAYGTWSDSFVVINKPAGIPVEDAANQADTVFSRSHFFPAWSLSF